MIGVPTNNKWKLLLFFFLLKFNFFGQIYANYVQNGSFEIYYDCNPPFKLQKCLGWGGVDSVSFGAQLCQYCAGTIPYNINTWQYPKSGNAYVISAIYYKNSINGYLRNRLKQTLKPGQTYCVQFYINIANTSPRGIDSFSALFADSTLDTISVCNVPLTYLSPQVSNPSGNVISDTLNWIPITGTFVANGKEKYLVLGNFKSNSAIITSTINGPFVQDDWTDVCFDDVSCIEMNVPAYAGPDRWLIPGDSIYIGRENDWAVDPYCTWYKLPNMTTAIDTISGMWVKPTVTTTYVVRQELECNSTKWDTVVIYINPSGVSKNFKDHSTITLFPVPASNEIFLQTSDPVVGFKTIEIFNTKAEKIKTIILEDPRDNTRIDLSGFPCGVYYFRLSSGIGETLGRTFVVER